jgi:hypothetical protein
MADQRTRAGRVARASKRRPRGTPAAEPSLLELRLPYRTPPHGLPEALQRAGAEARLVACRLTDTAPRRLLRWLDVNVAPERRDHLTETLRRRLGRRGLALAVLGPDRLLVRVSEPAPAVCVATAKAGAICVRCPLLGVSERNEWHLLVPRGPAAGALLRELQGGDAGPPAIARLRSYRSTATLTRRQDSALRTAYEVGYFDYPRRGTLADVARRLGAGKSATLEVLRRATAKLAQGRYGDELLPRPVP